MEGNELRQGKGRRGECVKGVKDESESVRVGAGGRDGF